MTSSKRTFIAQLGSILLAVPFLAAPADSRSYAGGRFAFEVSGVGVTYVKSFEGGTAVMAPVVRGTRADKYPDKSPGAVRYAEAVVEIPMLPPREFWDLVNSASSPNPIEPRTFTVTTLDINYVEKSRRVFEDSVISFVELPTFDGAGKDPGRFKLGFTVGRAKESSGTSGGKSSVTAGKAKTWVPSAFRLSIDGQAIRAAKVDAITIKRPQKGSLEYSNIVVSVGDADSDALRRWAGQSIDGKPVEKNGKIELLSPNQAEILLTIQLEGLGVVQFGPDTADPNASQIPRNRVELYVEKITFGAPPG